MWVTYGGKVIIVIYENIKKILSINIRKINSKSKVKSVYKTRETVAGF